MIKLIRQILSNRMVVSGVLMLVQLTVLWTFLAYISRHHYWFSFIFTVISLLLVIWIARKDDNPAYKISWIIFISLVPVAGGIFYLFWGNTPLNKSRLVRLKSINIKEFDSNILNVEPDDLSSISETFPRLAKYVQTIGGFPVYKGNECQYYKLGEEFLESLLINLQKAEKFIFLEYFIIEEGKMWDSILEILKEKARKGVEVRVMYDDAGCLSTLPSSYFKKLNKFGIKAVRFNPFRPSLNTYLNYRNHRKICVIDGEIGYIGGINLADEYINEIERFGHWKDNAMLITGDSVESLSMMFLELWEFASNEKTVDYSHYKSKASTDFQGYIQPFSDSPLDNYNVSENVYIHIINSAKKYVHITTPYLILDNEMVQALILASQSGVDVKIVTPHIPDKWYVHAVTRSFYKTLIDGGVAIYEYTPGFIHGKTIIADGVVGVLGTINMDFRSFYMHFECGAILYDCPILEDIKRDFFDIIDVSQQILLADVRKHGRFKAIFDSILRLFAPMM